MRSISVEGSSNLKGPQPNTQKYSIPKTGTTN